MIATIHTSKMNVGDIQVRDWSIIELPQMRLDGTGVDRHMFGYSDETYKWQLSSRIHDETEDYIETRSRKYFKNGPAVKQLPPEGLEVLVHLLRQWRESEESIEAIVALHGGFPT